MNISVNEKRNNISVMIATIKFGIIVFVTIVLYINLINYFMKNMVGNALEPSLYNAASLLAITILLFVSWLIVNRTVLQTINVFRISWLFETVFYTILVLLPNILNASENYEYRLIFLLLILAVAIQYGSKYGITTSIFISVAILTWDLIAMPLVDGVNMGFQKDIIVVSIFIFISWIIGYYVDTEFKKNISKEKKIMTLSSELEIQQNNRRNIEELLFRNKVCYDLLFENSQNAILLHHNGVIQYANKSAAKLLGYNEFVELSNISIYNHYNLEDLKRTKEKYTDITSNKLSKIIYEDKIKTCNGRTISVRNTSSYFIYEGQPSILTFYYDITPEIQYNLLKENAEDNLKLLNETKEFNVLITEFFTNISHEIKTPVNVIYAAIQAINMYIEKYNTLDGNKCKSYLATMKQNCLRMIKLINNLLDLTKADSGYVQIHKTNGDLVSVVEEITQSVITYLKTRNIQLIFDTNIEEKIMAFDCDMIERIMLNLISNAFKYSNSGGIIFVNFEDKGSSVEIKVRDQGKGISAEKLDVIFERFGQANRTLCRECEGTGIGLYLVKSFVEMHDGKISVKSEQGKGSEFIIEIPVEILENKKDTHENIFTNKVERIDIEFSDIYQNNFNF
jgi:PAS domain S-box-containing protein